MNGRKKNVYVVLLYSGTLVCLLAVLAMACTPVPEDQSRIYSTLTEPHPDGTGRVYMGREIARVRTSEQELAWFERADRSSEELPERLIEAINLRPTDDLAEIGAGTGYMLMRIAPRVPRGKVIAVEIQQSLLDQIMQRADSLGVRNIEPILGSIDDPKLAQGSVDVVLIVGAYTVFSHPHEMLAGIYEGLRPGGRLVIVEYRAEDPTIPVPLLYRISYEQLRKEVEGAGLIWDETREFLPQQHFAVFRKPLR